MHSLVAQLTLRIFTESLFSGSGSLSGSEFVGLYSFTVPWVGGNSRTNICPLPPRSTVPEMSAIHVQTSMSVSVSVPFRRLYPVPIYVVQFLLFTLHLSPDRGRCNP